MCLCVWLCAPELVSVSVSVRVSMLVCVSVFVRLCLLVFVCFLVRGCIFCVVMHESECVDECVGNA